MSDSHSLILFPSQYISDFKLCFCLLLDIKHFTWKAPLLGRHCWGVSEDPDAPAGLTWAVLMLSWEFRVFSVWWMWSYGGMCQKNHRVSQASHWMRCFLMFFFFSSYQWKMHVRVWCESRKLRRLMKLVTDGLISLHVVWHTNSGLHRALATWENWMFNP